MSIRLIAKDLYRVMRESEDLRRRLAQAPVHERPALEEALRRCRAEQENLRRALEGAKG